MHPMGSCVCRSQPWGPDDPHARLGCVHRNVRPPSCRASERGACVARGCVSGAGPARFCRDLLGEKTRSPTPLGSEGGGSSSGSERTTNCERTVVVVKGPRVPVPRWQWRWAQHHDQDICVVVVAAAGNLAAGAAIAAAISIVTAVAAFATAGTAAALTQPAAAHGSGLSRAHLPPDRCRRRRLAAHRC